MEPVNVGWPPLSGLISGIRFKSPLIPLHSLLAGPLGRGQARPPGGLANTGNLIPVWRRAEGTATCGGGGLRRRSQLWRPRPHICGGRVRIL